MQEAERCGACMQGLLVATEFRDRVYPPWLPPQVHEPPFVLKVLEALTTEGCRDNINHERCVFCCTVT